MIYSIPHSRHPLNPKNRTLFQCYLACQCHHSSGAHNSRGTAILSKRNIQYEIVHEGYCKEGNFVILVCSIFIAALTIVNIYGPNDDHSSFFNNINKTLSDLPTDDIIIVGVPDQSIVCQIKPLFKLLQAKQSRLKK